jgi:hypothetical protein|tara:strand:- start:97 stop:558 length:462 start_codon:yes stop_codon:yes gene_type:complete
MSDTPYWDDVIVDAVKVATSPGLFVDTTKSFRQLFEKEDYVSMGVKAYDEWADGHNSDHAERSFLAKVLIRKQTDYGSANIMDGPFGPDVGIKVRLWDKIARYENLTKEEMATKTPQFESLNDTLLDIIGYVCLDWMVAAGAMNYPLSTEGTK